MTLIATHLCRSGIVLASDSNLTKKTPLGAAPAGEGQKTFALAHLRAGLSVAGAFSVKGERMDNWMHRFIAKSVKQGNGSLADFAGSLRTTLESEMTPEEKKSGRMVHIAGYVLAQNTYHPEFHFVRNIYTIKPSGEYDDVKNTFLVSEDFWNRDCQCRQQPTGFERDENYHFYTNGFAEGRIGYVILQRQLAPLFGCLWSQPQWHFRPPKSLKETECFVRLYMSFIHGLFEVSDYSAPYIGGAVQICGIPPP